MKTFLAIIGFVFVMLSLFGATAPNYHFHVVFGSDDVALKFHQKQVEHLQKDKAPIKGL